MKALFITIGISCSLIAQPSSPCQVPSDFDRGDDPLPSCGYAPAYNLSADIDLKDSFHCFGTLSYLYWYAGQEGMDLATTALYSVATNKVNGPTSQGSIQLQNFTYQSGFKVGLGGHITTDDWVIRADYTYLRSNTSKSSSVTLPDVLFLTNWYFQLSALNQPLAGTHLSSKWHLGLDLLDVSLTRPFYQGRKKTLTPFVGMRAAWIRQSLNLGLSGIANTVAPQEPIFSDNDSNSWGLGPRAGIEGHWLIGRGVRFQGNLGGSLLFTQFTHITHSEGQAVTPGYPISYALHDYNCLRPMLETGLGLGFGTYFAKHAYHFDLSADYDFNYLWGQNMIRFLNDLEVLGNGIVSGALYLHGLTLTARFDF